MASDSVPELFAQIFTVHNAYRAIHQVAPLTWDRGLANGSSTWAMQCIWAHDNSSEAQNHGENLYVQSYFAPTAAGLSMAAEAWYGEVKNYDYSNPSFSVSTGHFAQIVWKATLRIGCAYSACQPSTFIIPGGIFVVCRYSPPGNVQGGFAQNVLPATAAAPPASGFPSVLSTSPPSDTPTAAPPAAGAQPSGADPPAPVRLRITAVVGGYWRTTFAPSVFLAALAATLGVDVDRVILKAVRNAPGSRRAGPAVTVTADVVYPAGTDPAAALRAAAAAGPDLGARLRAGGMPGAAVASVAPAALAAPPAGEWPFVSDAAIAATGLFGLLLVTLLAALLLREPPPDPPPKPRPPPPAAGPPAGPPPPDAAGPPPPDAGPPPPDAAGPPPPDAGSPAGGAGADSVYGGGLGRPARVARPGPGLWTVFEDGEEGPGFKSLGLGPGRIDYPCPPTPEPGGAPPGAGGAAAEADGAEAEADGAEGAAAAPPPAAEPTHRLWA
jgi:hypothetical protein